MPLNRGLLSAAFLSASLALVAASPCVAGVENTHHDMRLVTGQDEKPLCGYCHLPHNALSEKGLFARDSGTESLLGRIGSFCYSCHDGTVSPKALIEAPNGDVGIKVLLNSHGFVPGRMAAKSAWLEDEKNLNASGLIDKKKDKSVAEEEEMSCLTCHDVHNAAYPPFLRVPLDSLCERCHSGSDMNGKGRYTKVEAAGADNLAHPVGMRVAPSGLDKKRNIPVETSFHGPDPVFNFPVLTHDEVVNPNKHWDLGGHLDGDKKHVGCSTCHSAHMPAKNLLVAAAAVNPAEVVCSGCHGDGKNPANPGVTKYYHPVFGESAPPYVHDHGTHDGTGLNQKDNYFNLFVDMPGQYPIESDGTLTCLSCHTPHGGKAGHKALRPGSGDWLAQSICNDCHRYSEEQPRPGMHHPITTRNEAELDFATLPPWALGPGLVGDLADGLQCVDCHVELAKSAHNW